MAGQLTIDTLKASSGVLATQNGMTGIAKAWVQFTGSSATINGSFNVSSVTRVATGNWQVNFSTSMTNANFAVVYTPGNNNNATYYTGAYPASASQAVIWNYNGSSQVDTANNSVAVFGA